MQGSWFQGSNLTHQEVWYLTTTYVTSSCSSPENDSISRIMYARAVTRHRGIYTMFLVTSANIADIAHPRMTAPLAAMFGPAFSSRSHPATCIVYAIV